jgi:hypothetical protein
LLVPSPVTSSSGHFRTVHNHNTTNGFATLTSQNKKRSNLHKIFPSINTNNSNNNIHLNESSSPSIQKRLSRTPVKTPFENHHTIRNSRPKSAVPSSLTENSAFHIVHNPNSNHINNQHQQQQYVALLQFLKSQELQLEKQQKELNEKQNGIFRRHLKH